MKFNQFTSFILVVFLGSFVFSCGQMTAKDDGLDSKTIEEASGTSGETENSSDGSGEDSGLDNSTDNTTSSTAGFTIGTISGNNTESGGTATFTVKLNTQPSADVLIAVSSSDTTEGTVRPSSLSFTSSNYNSAQTVTVTGIDDSAVDGNKNFRIILAAASSSDSNYNGLNPDDVSVTNTDETAGFIVDNISGNTTEAGGTAIFTAKLNSQPTADVSIAVSSSDTTEGTVSPSSLTFSSSNYNTAQTVTVTGVDDPTIDGHQSFSIITAAATSSDSNYNGLNPTDVTVTNTDNDYRLPDTGQTTGFTATFGEDNDYTINAPSFTDNGNSTVTDNNTGLIWQQQDDGTTRNWSDAVSYCSNLSLGGYTDWSLPEAYVLQTIIDYGDTSNLFDTTYFPNPKSYYWLSDTSQFDSDNAWITSGFMIKSFGKDKTDSLYNVLCVRGVMLTSIFTNNDDGTVTDQKTGLVWQQSARSDKWTSALSYCENLTLGNKSDWRLPNIKELGSIVDVNAKSPAINTTAFPYTSSYYFWSSTSENNISARDVYFHGGGVSTLSKAFNGYRMHCVRGGH